MAVSEFSALGSMRLSIYPEWRGARVVVSTDKMLKKYGMKHWRYLTCCLAMIALTGCSERKGHDFFAAGGVTVGVPIVVEHGVYRIPIEFETKIVHAGQWIDTVGSEVTGADIFVTARVTTTARKSRYPGYIELKGVAAGSYTLNYRDPNGSVHSMGSVLLP